MFFSWFFVECEGVGHIKIGGEFLLPEYGVLFCPGMGQLWLSLQAQCSIVQMSHMIMITLVCHTQQNAMCKKKPQHGMKRFYHSLKIVSTTKYFIIIVFQFFCSLCCV